MVESQHIGIVEVGEPTLNDLNRTSQLIGIDEAELMKSNNATFENAFACCAGSTCVVGLLCDSTIKKRPAK